MGEYEVAPPPTRLAHAVQLRLGFSTEQGTVAKFVAQLEYWLDGDWRTVLRYDHDRDAPGGHDVTEEGLHRDVYRRGRRWKPSRLRGRCRRIGHSNAPKLI